MEWIAQFKQLNQKICKKVVINNKKNKPNF